MNELLAAAKAVIRQYVTHGKIRRLDINNLRAAVERAEKQERVGFGEWFEYQDKYLTAEETWIAAKEDERERIRARVRLAAISSWSASEVYIGPPFIQLQKFVDRLLEDSDE